MIVFACSMIGILKSNTIITRVVILKQVILMVEKIQLYIRYNQIKTKNLIYNLSGMKEFSKLHFLSDCSKNMKKGTSFSISWKLAIDNFFGETEQNDRKIIIGLSTIIGKSDILGQINELESFKKMIIHNLEEAEEISKRKAMLYPSCGFLFGLFVVIFFI